jgi:glutamyl-tRNA reductase
MTAGECQIFFQVVKGFGFSRKEQQHKNLMARLFVTAVPIDLWYQL